MRFVIKSKNIFGLFLFILFIIFFSNSVFAWNFTGVAYNITGSPLENAIVNVTIRDQTFTEIGSNATATNSTGGFALNVSDVANWMYQPTITHYIGNSNGTTAVDWVGQSLPAFPFREVQSGMNVNFYLRDGGTPLSAAPMK